VSSALRLPAAEAGFEVAPEADRAEKAFVRRIVLFGFLVRLAVALILEWTGYSRRFAPDETTYTSDGWPIGLYWAGELLVKPWRMTLDQPIAYFYLNGLSYYLFGATQVPLKVLNALVGALSSRFLYRLARDLFGVAVARRATLLFAFFPSLVLWSALNIRDAWVVFLILFISCKSLQVTREYSHSAAAQLLLGVYVIAQFRDYLFYVVALPPVVAFLLVRRGHLVRNLVLASLAALAAIVLMQQGIVGKRTTSRMSLEGLSQTRQDLATGGSAFHGQADVSTPGKAVMFLPVGITYFFFSPFPWEITSLLKAFSLPEMILIYLLTPAALRGIGYAARERLRDCFQVLMLTGLLTVSYALGEGNVGTLYRHRAQVLGFYLMFAAVGKELAARPRAAASEP
jgi:Dolichyl-phosphate-mannose-protein mannosyltransferase